ncbi:MAG: hypothetical protein B6244_01525 [Candidatus Cloacimonetes bacterium 4572_55]|nr:MAG: hypothetical protein B6244_01525 [Candidatus Cloacimonetes bacterium 4572_55]
MAKSKTKILAAARKFTKKGKWDKAIAEYEALLELDPEDPAPLNYVGDLYTKLGKLSEAIDYYRQSIDLYFESSLYNNAIAICKKVLRADPSQAQIYQKLAHLYRENGLTNDAIRHFIIYADKMHEKSNLEEVLEAFESVVELSPSNIDIRLRLTEFYMKQGHTSNAIKQLVAVSRHYDEIGEIEKSEELRQRIAEIDPEALGQLEEKISEPEEKLSDSDMNSDSDMDFDSGDLIEFDSGGGDDEFEDDDDEMELKLDSEEEELKLDSEEEELKLDSEEEELKLDSEEEELKLDSEEMELKLDSEEEEFDFPEEDDFEDAPVQEITESFSTEEEPEEELDIGLDDDDLQSLSTGEDAIEKLRLHLSQYPDDNNSRLKLGEALRESSPDQAFDELVEAGDGFLSQKIYASSVNAYRKANTIRPDNLRVHKNMLEAAANEGDIQAVVESYLNLGDTFSRFGESQKAIFVFQKVMAIDKNNDGAKARIEAIEKAVVEQEEMQEVVDETPVSSEQRVDEPNSSVFEESYDDESGGIVDLEELLRDDDENFKPHTGKIRIERKDLDTSLELDDIINDFKAGVQEHIEDEDYESHYDLGLAYKEMGLIEESISEFQIATRSSKQRLKAFEMLGMCFFEKNDLELALKQFQRGVATPGHSDFEYLGLYYNIGLINEKLGRWRESKKSYEEVYVVDIGFKDVGDRINYVQKQLK